MKLELAYLGWSGFLVEAADRPDLARLLFDPPPGHALAGRPTVILITHGHPEHIWGASRLVGEARRDPVTVVGSRAVCGFLRRRSRNPGDAFLPVEPNEQVIAGGWHVHVFEWDHMTLLPPGWRVKATYLAKLALHPLRLARIGWSGVLGPRHRPMLGFRAEPSEGGPAIAYLGEGLHRCTTDERLLGTMGSRPLRALIAGVEPEDASEIPKLLRSRPIGCLVAFEPHRVWREQFEMPQADLSVLSRRLLENGVMSWTPAPGATISLS